MAGSGTDYGHDGVGASGSWADELLDQLRPGARDIGRVAAWLAGTIDAEVSLQDVTGTLLAGDRLPAADDLVMDVATGRIASAAVHTQGRHVRLAGLGHPATKGVLAVASSRPFDRRATDIVARTAWVLEVLLRERETISAEHRLDRATSDLRLAILQLLMVGDIIAARRVAAGLWPGLFDTDTACVYVLEGQAARRDELAEDCQEAAEGHALIVRCPAVDEHLIVVAPIDRGQDRAGPELRTLVGERPDTFIGGSVRQNLAQTATAYGQAISALAVARFRPDRAAVYAERTHPERLMNPSPCAAGPTGCCGPSTTCPTTPAPNSSPPPASASRSPPSRRPSSSASAATPCAPGWNAWKACSTPTSRTSPPGPPSNWPSTPRPPSRTDRARPRPRPPE